jgi:hypothetical protein
MITTQDRPANECVTDDDLSHPGQEDITDRIPGGTGMIRYQVLVVTEGGCSTASAPDLGGCIAIGGSAEEAVAAVHRIALRISREYKGRNGLPAPSLLTLAEIELPQQHDRDAAIIDA